MLFSTKDERGFIRLTLDRQFGIARSFQAMVTGQMEVFRDEAAAIDWLVTGSAQFSR